MSANQNATEYDAYSIDKYACANMYGKYDGSKCVVVGCSNMRNYWSPVHKSKSAYKCCKLHSKVECETATVRCRNAQRKDMIIEGPKRYCQRCHVYCPLDHFYGKQTQCGLKGTGRGGLGTQVREKPLTGEDCGTSLQQLAVRTAPVPAASTQAAQRAVQAQPVGCAVSAAIAATISAAVPACISTSATVTESTPQSLPEGLRVAFAPASPALQEIDNKILELTSSLEAARKRARELEQHVEALIELRSEQERLNKRQRTLLESM